MNNPRVTVAVFNFHGRGQLESCLKSLADQEFTDWELVIIDNSREDGLLEELEARSPLMDWRQESKAWVVTNKRNAGFAKAANQAIDRARGEFILLLNQDVFMEPGYIGNLVSVLDRDPQIASITGKLLRTQASEGPKIIDSTGHEFYDDRVVINRGKGEEDKGQYDEECEVFGVSAAAAMYRISALKEIAFRSSIDTQGRTGAKSRIGAKGVADTNGEIFDEDFFAYLEDIDIDFRLRRAGYKAWYTPSAIAHHALAGSGGRRNFSIRFRAHTNRYKIIWKHDSFPLIMRDILPILRQEVLQFIRTLFTSPFLLLSFFILPFRLPRIIRQRTAINRQSRLAYPEIYNRWVKHGRLNAKS